MKSKESAPYARLRGAWAVAERLDDFLVGNVKTTLELLWGSVALVLLVSCSNGAGVLLVRAIARQGETGVRLAIGRRAEGRIPSSELLASKTADDRFRTALLGLFAAIAVVLAGSGIFSTVSFTVSKRTREIAIRRALGATAASVCAAALRGALAACAIGAAVGLTAAYWLRSLTDGMLFEVDPVDPAAYAPAAIALLLLALAAALGPASKAARLDPARNLRAD